MAERRSHLVSALTVKRTERERVIELHRRGRINADEADRELDSVAAEVSALHDQIQAVDDEVATAEALEHDLCDAAVMLADIVDELDDVERSDDLNAKRSIIERLVRKVTVTTLPSERKHRKPYRLTLELRFSAPPVDVVPQSLSRTTTSNPS